MEIANNLDVYFYNNSSNSSYKCQFKQLKVIRKSEILPSTIDANYIDQVQINAH